MKKKKIMIKPQEGIIVNGEKIVLGKRIKQAEGILTLDEKRDDSYYDEAYYFEDAYVAMGVKNDKIIEIELRRDEDEANNLQVFFEEMEVFKEKKEKVSELFTSKNLEPPIEEDEYTQYFKNLGIKLYTSILVSEVEEMIEESKEDGVYEEMLEDIQKDMERAKYVETIVILPGEKSV